MAQCKKSVYEFIKDSFTPRIAILCSEDAENICLKNNLKFVDLLKPFSVIKETQIADSSGTLISLQNLKVVFEDINARPPQPTLAKKLLNDIVSSTPWVPVSKIDFTNSFSGSPMKLDYQPSTPWYEAWREAFLDFQFPSDHEFSRHYIACVIVVSSSSENPLDHINRLSQYQHQQQHQMASYFPKWFSPNIMKYYVLLHDISSSDCERGQEIFQEMTSSFGSQNCHFLQINSISHGQTDNHVADSWSSFLKHKIKRESAIFPGGSSSTSSGTVTPREDIVSMPGVVIEGNTADESELVAHPLSPSQPYESDEKNNFTEGIPPDIPIIINSSCTLPAYTVDQNYGCCLSASDIDRICIFFNEFSQRALIPHVERQIRYFYDTVTNRSKSKSLLSATRRWLGGNKVPGNTANSVTYSHEAMELQTRRLGDMCFLFGLYEMAYSAYHTAKNDFKSDQAWMYFSGAQEMAGFAAFLNNNKDFPKHYVESSIQTYMNVCKVYNFAIRCSLIGTEILKHFDNFGEAALMFIKLTSEESDLLSALMLEQAAHSFLNAQKPLLRKFAFHMTLAGHRYSKAGQKNHAYRAYTEALQVYSGRNWRLAEDHIYFTLGKQSSHLKKYSEGLQAFGNLINYCKRIGACETQSVNQQISYLREYIQIYQHFVAQETGDNIIELPIPIFNNDSITILLGDSQQSFDDSSWISVNHISPDVECDHERWLDLEQKIVSKLHGPPTVFNPSLQFLSSKTNNYVKPFVPVGECILFTILVKNPLHINLIIKDIALLFNFMPFELDSNCSAAISQSFPKLCLEPNSEERLLIELRPHYIGELEITGVSYKLLLSGNGSVNSSSVIGKQSISVRGKRLNNTTSEKCNIVYAPDKRLEISIVPVMPKLSVYLKSLPVTVFAGEMFSIPVNMKNSGSAVIKYLFLGVGDPKHIFYISDNISVDSNKVFSVPLFQSTKTLEYAHPILLPSSVLNPGEHVNGEIAFRAPLTDGKFTVQLLFYYQSECATKYKYRLFKHFAEINIIPSISVKALSTVSCNIQKLEMPLQILPHILNFCIYVENCCSDGEKIDLVGVRSCSQYWCLVPHTEMKVYSFSSLEYCELCVQGVHRKQVLEENIVSYVPFLSVQNIPNTSLKFSLLEKLKAANDWVALNAACSGSGQMLSDEEQFLKHIEKMTSLDMAITLIWKKKRNENDVWGQHTVYLNHFDEEVIIGPVSSRYKRSLPEEGEKAPVRIIKDTLPVMFTDSLLQSSAKLGNLVKAELQFDEIIRHNFKISRLLSIRYVLWLHNCCNYNFQLLLELNCSKIESSNQMFTPQARSTLGFVGISKKAVSLESWTSVAIPVKAVVTTPGTYCLGSLKLCIKFGNQEILQSCQLQDVVVVHHDPLVISS